MFFRTKKAGPRTYLQIVENHRIGGKIQQRVIATLGRLEELQSSGQRDALVLGGALCRSGDAAWRPTERSAPGGEHKAHRRGTHLRALVAGDGVPGRHRFSFTRAPL
jgi:hypothetical protein